MYAKVEMQKETRSTANGNVVSQNKCDTTRNAGFVDGRQDDILQRNAKIANCKSAQLENYKIDSNNSVLQRIIMNTNSTLFGEDFRRHHLHLINTEEFSQGIFNDRGVEKNTTFTYTDLPDQIDVQMGDFDINLRSSALYARELVDPADRVMKIGISEATGPITVRANNNVITHLEKTYGIQPGIKYYNKVKKPLRIIRNGAAQPSLPPPPTNLLD